MRVGIDAHVLNGKFQGSRTWLEEILPRAVRQAPDITFVVYSFAPQDTRRIVDGPNVEHRPIPRLPAALRLLAFWPWARAAHRLDLAVFQYIAPPLGAGASLVVVHDILFETHPHFFPWLTRLRNRLLVRLSARRARLVVTVSQFSRAALLRRYGLAESAVRVVPNGAMPAAETDGGPVPPHPYALFVGRLEPRKNLTGLLDAMARVRHREARLVVVGRDDFEEPQTLQRLQADRRVLHLERIEPPDLAALYRGAAVTVFPSRAEGFGVPVLEAFAHGCPVIAARRTAITEVGGRAARYFDPDAPDAADALARLLDRAFSGNLALDPSLARERLDRFDWTRSATAFVAALRQAASVNSTFTCIN